MHRNGLLVLVCEVIWWPNVDFINSIRAEIGPDVLPQFAREFFGSGYWRISSEIAEFERKQRAGTAFIGWKTLDRDLWLGMQKYQKNGILLLDVEWKHANLTEC
jgi:hypothetical protein